ALAAALASIDATARVGESRSRLPFRRHLAPLDVRVNANDWDRDAWDDTTNSQALAVWTGRDLVRDATAVLERRLLEAERRRFVKDGKEATNDELPLRSSRAAPLESITAFLAGRTDDARIAALAAGLAWVRGPGRGPAAAERQGALPFAYVA